MCALYLAWRGAGPDEQIWWASSDDAANWSPQRAVPGVGSSHGPILVPSQDGLYMFWKGAGDDTRIFWSLSLDGNEWTAQQQSPPKGHPLGTFGTSETPGAANFEDAIHLFWKGPYDESIWRSAAHGYLTPSGRHALNWTDHEPFFSPASAETDDVSTQALRITRNSPAVLAMEQRLYLAGQRANDDGIFVWSRARDDAFYLEQMQDLDGYGTSDGPALAPKNTTSEGSPEKLLMYWKGSGDDHAIWHATSEDNGFNWSGQTQVPNVGTDYRPALAAWGDNVFAAWKGIGDDNRIYTGYCTPGNAETALWRNPATHAPLNPGEHVVDGIGTRHRPALAVF